MTDRELLEDVQSKLSALEPRVVALEEASAGSVTHEEVQTVVDKEADLETRVSALEGGTVAHPVETPPSGDTFPTTNPDSGDSGSADSTEPEQHTIS